MGLACCCEGCCPCATLESAWNNGKCLNVEVGFDGSTFTGKLEQISPNLECSFWRGYVDIDNTCANGTMKIDIICIKTEGQYPFPKGTVIASIASGFGWPHIGCAIAGETGKEALQINCDEPGDFAASWEWTLTDAPTCFCGDGSKLTLSVTEADC